MNKSLEQTKSRAVLALLVPGFCGMMLLCPPAPMSAQAGEAKTGPGVRFDELVRNDFFAGMMGDKERLDRGMKFCEDILAKDPKHADALVWHGGGLLTRAANAYRKGDQTLGDKLWDLGLKEMNEAVELQPGNMGIKIGRSATIIGVAQSGWDSTDRENRTLLESALVDYEKGLDNLRSRLAALFREGASLSIDSQEGGTTVSVLIALNLLATDE